MPLTRLRAETMTGERLSFEDFFLTEYPSLRKLLAAVTGSADEAEEIAQEAMARALERWDSVSRMVSPAGYVFVTAVNLERKRVRHLVRRARVLSELRLVRSSPSPDASTELSTLLSSLPQGQRTALVLTEWLGLTAEEASEVLGIAASSVRSRVHRARATLRRQREDEETSDE
jgi:RNA polymerase sigma-70 factor (ECF subfamily)